MRASLRFLLIAALLVQAEAHLAVRLLLSAALLAALIKPAPLWACACGCGVFDVGMGAMLPTGPGGLAYLEYDYMNQNKNWSGNSGSASSNNGDKQITTDFFTAGTWYMFSRSWGVIGELPVWERHFKTTDDGGNIADFDHAALGDVRLKGVYSGFSADMSSGLTFGLKLPTGDYAYPHFDRDTEIGTGSADVLLGGYSMGRIPALKDWNWFAYAQLDQPVLVAGGYRPGGEVDANAGAYYDRWRIGGVKIAPMAEMIESCRWRDSGIQSNSGDSGYERFLLAPGVEVDAAGMRIFGDVGFPVYQFVNGNQLAAAELYQLNAGWAF